MDGYGCMFSSLPVKKLRRTSGGIIQPSYALKTIDKNEREANTCRFCWKGTLDSSGYAMSMELYQLHPFGGFFTLESDIPGNFLIISFGKVGGTPIPLKWEGDSFPFFLFRISLCMQQNDSYQFTLIHIRLRFKLKPHTEITIKSHLLQGGRATTHFGMWFMQNAHERYSAMHLGLM